MYVWYKKLQTSNEYIFIEKKTYKTNYDFVHTNCMKDINPSHLMLESNNLFYVHNLISKFIEI